MGIGVELMEDPVIASDGQTYDRKHITDFFNNGANNNSPFTGLPFANHDLKPNKKRKAEIDGYLKLKNEGNSVEEIIKYLISLNPAVPPQGAAPAEGSDNLEPYNSDEDKPRLHDLSSYNSDEDDLSLDLNSDSEYEADPLTPIYEADELEGAPAPEFYQPEPAYEPVDEPPVDEPQPDPNDDDIPHLRKPRYGCRPPSCTIS